MAKCKRKTQGKQLKFRAATEESSRRLEWVLYCEVGLTQQDALSEALELWLAYKEEKWGPRHVPEPLVEVEVDKQSGGVVGPRSGRRPGKTEKAG